MPDELVIADSIAQLSRDDWDALTEDDVYGRYGWLQTVESTVREAQHTRYFLLYRDGRPLAAAAMYAYGRAEMAGRLGDLLFGRAARLAGALRLAPRRTLYCGPILGQGRHVFWDRRCTPQQASERIRAMLHAIVKSASDDRLPVVFGRIPDDETFLVRELRAFQCIESLTWPISYIDVTWSTFDDYLKSLSRFGKNMSTKARREVAAPGKAGITIESRQEFADDAAEIQALFEQTRRSHGNETGSLDGTFIETLENNHRGGAVMNTALESDGRTIAGCALLLQAGDRAGGPLIGVSKSELNRKAFTYFNLSLYTPVRYCIEHRISRVYFGSGMGPMKRKRGCQEMQVRIFVIPAGFLSGVAWRAWMWLHRRWITRKSARESAGSGHA